MEKKSRLLSFNSRREKHVADRRMDIQIYSSFDTNDQFSLCKEMDGKLKKNYR